MQLSVVHCVAMAIVALTTTVLPAEDSFLARQDKIMWIGDSITAQNLYETYAMRVLHTLYPDGQLSDVNCGTGGATAPTQFGLATAKLAADRPTVLTAMFGVNDTAWSPGDAEPKIEKYIAGLRQYVDLAKQHNVPLLLLRETHFSHNKPGEPFVDRQNALLKQLFAAQDQLARQANVSVVDVFGAYTRELAEAWKVDPNYEFTPNVIHPTHLGHTAVAGEILKAFGAGLPLASPGSRGPLHLADKQPVELAAEAQCGVVAPGGPLAIKIRITNRGEQAASGQLLVVVGATKLERTVSLAAGGSETVDCELPAAAFTQRWEVQPIYLAFVGADLFSAAETPLYYSQLTAASDQPFVPGAKEWTDWEGRNPLASAVSDLNIRVGKDSLRAEFTWNDSTPVLAQMAPYKARLGAPVDTPLDMTSPFGQPCDAVEMLVDLRGAESSARYTSNMDSIPEGTARVGLYRIDEGGQPVYKLQVSPAERAKSFQLAELGDHRFAIQYRGAIPACGAGVDFLVTDAKEYAPNKTLGAYLTSVLAVGTDWVDFYRLSAGQQGVFCRVGY